MEDEVGKYKAKEIMEENFVGVNKKSTIGEVARKIINRQTSEALVLEGKKVVGIVTLRDIVRAVGMGISHKASIETIMTTDIIASNEEEYLINILKKMRDNRISRMPIVNNKNEIVGIINEKRIIEIMPSILEVLYEKDKINENDYKGEEEIREGFCEICGNYSDSLRYVDGKLICETCYEDEYNE